MILDAAWHRKKVVRYYFGNALILDSPMIVLDAEQLEDFDLRNFPEKLDVVASQVYAK